MKENGLKVFQIEQIARKMKIHFVKAEWERTRIHCSLLFDNLQNLPSKVILIDCGFSFPVLGINKVLPFSTCLRVSK